MPGRKSQRLLIKNVNKCFYLLFVFFFVFLLHIIFKIFLSIADKFLKIGIAFCFAVC